MLGRVTATHQHVPGVPCKRQAIAFDQSLVGLRQWRDKLAEHAKHFLVAMHRLGRKSCGMVETRAFFRCVATGVGYKHAAQQVLVACHPQINTELVGQPTGAANVVGVHMCDDNVIDRLVTHDVGDRGLPDLPADLRINPGIDNSPAVIVFD